VIRQGIEVYGSLQDGHNAGRVAVYQKLKTRVCHVVLRLSKMMIDPREWRHRGERSNDSRSFNFSVRTLEKFEIRTLSGCEKLINNRRISFWILGMIQQIGLNLFQNG
jgi:hypothetical protein